MLGSQDGLLLLYPFLLQVEELGVQSPLSLILKFLLMC